jgi:hypothetical protein
MLENLETVDCLYLPHYTARQAAGMGIILGIVTLPVLPHSFCPGLQGEILCQQIRLVGTPTSVENSSGAAPKANLAGRQSQVNLTIGHTWRRQHFIG